MATRPNKKTLNTAELIRCILDGSQVPLMKRRLFKVGGDAVEPILHAITGRHGRLHPDRLREGVDDLIDVLVAIAKKDVTPLAAAMAHHVPGLNAVVWALGHSKSNHARDILDDLRDHEDHSIRAVAHHHLNRNKEWKGAGSTLAKKRPAAKKKATAKKGAQK